MEKLTLYLVNLLSLFSFLSGPGTCMEVVQQSEHAIHGPRHIELSSTMDNHTHVWKIAASAQNISDDFIVAAIKNPAPISVSEALTEIIRLSADYEKVDIDLSNNTICDEGAGIIGDKLSKMNWLVSVDLSWNRITDDGIAALITHLRPVLLRSGFVGLSIIGNYGANRANIRKILASFETSERDGLMSKIKFE